MFRTLAFTIAILLAVGASVFVVQKKKRDEQAARSELIETGKKQRDDLLKLYVQRAELISQLLASIPAPPLKAEWIQTSSWSVKDDESLARLDQDQTSISNHLAQFLSKVEMYKERKANSASSLALGAQKRIEEIRKKAEELERFEQSINRLRASYAGNANLFRQKSQVDRATATQDFPLFPVERLLLDKSTATKARN